MKGTSLTYGSVDQLAKEIGLSRGSAYKALQEGIIPSIRLGKRFILPRAAIAEWLRSAGDWESRVVPVKVQPVGTYTYKRKKNK